MSMQTQANAKATTTPGVAREMLALALRALLSGTAVAVLAALMIVALTIIAG